MNYICVNKNFHKITLFPTQTTFLPKTFLSTLLKVKPVIILIDFSIWRCEWSVNKSCYIVNY